MAYFDYSTGITQNIEVVHKMLPSVFNGSTIIWSLRSQWKKVERNMLINMAELMNTENYP